MYLAHIVGGSKTSESETKTTSDFRCPDQFRASLFVLRASPIAILKLAVLVCRQKYVVFLVKGDSQVIRHSNTT